MVKICQVRKDSHIRSIYVLYDVAQSSHRLAHLSRRTMSTITVVPVQLVTLERTVKRTSMTVQPSPVTTAARVLTS